MHIKYKDWILGKTSHAAVLHSEKKFKELDKHLKQLETDNKQLMERYGDKDTKNRQSINK